MRVVALVEHQRLRRHRVLRHAELVAGGDEIGEDAVDLAESRRSSDSSSDTPWARLCAVYTARSSESQSDMKRCPLRSISRRLSQ